jgi:SOS response regulatory protein OraA/RecX
VAAEAYRKSIQLLARRPHFERELDNKLRARGFDDAERSETLERLRNESLIDDREAALGFVATRLRKGPVGRRRMRAELTRRGAGEEAIEEALSTGMPRDELELAHAAAAAWLRRRRLQRDALMRHLDRLGFSPRDIVTAVERLAERPDSAEDV